MRKRKEKIVGEETKYVAYDTILAYGDVKRYKKSLGVYEISGSEEDYRMKLKNYDPSEDQETIILLKAIIETGKGKVTIDSILEEKDQDYIEMYEEIIEELKKENKLEKTKEAEKEKKPKKN